MSDCSSNYETLILSLGTMFFAFLTLSVRYCYRSKCKDVTCCCLSFKRDVIGEEKIDEGVMIRDNPRRDDSFDNPNPPI